MIVNHRKLHIESSGSPNDYPVVFLHHGLGSTLAWRNQVPAFVNAGFYTITYDRWGYGKSEERSHLAVPGFEDDLEDLGALLDVFDLETVSLVGHSDGGSIALYYAAAHPNRVKALVTVAAHIYLEPSMEPGIQGIKRSFDQDHRFRKGLLRTHGQKFESTFNNWFDGWHTSDVLKWDMRPTLPGIRCPTLVIQGDEDEHASLKHAIDIAENIPDAKLWLVPGVKHMLPQEIPDEFNRKVIDFLKISELDVGR